MKIEGKVGLHVHGQQGLCLFPRVSYECLVPLLMTAERTVMFVLVGCRPGALWGGTDLEINMCLHVEGRLVFFMLGLFLFPLLQTTLYRNLALGQVSSLTNISAMPSDRYDAERLCLCKCLFPEHFVQ